MVQSRAAKLLLRAATSLTLVFIYLPLGVITLYSFNDSRSLTWPIPGFTLHWWGKALDNPGARDALLTSV